MKNKQNSYTKIVKLLEKLHTTHPSITIGRHISTALGEFSDVWGVSDEEVFKCFLAYQERLETDVSRETSNEQEEIERIIYEGTHLPTILEDNEEEL